MSWNSSLKKIPVNKYGFVPFVLTLFPSPTPFIMLLSRILAFKLIWKVKGMRKRAWEFLIVSAVVGKLPHPRETLPGLLATQ